MEPGEPVQHVPDHLLLRQDRRAEVEGAGLLPEPWNDYDNNNTKIILTKCPHPEPGMTQMPVSSSRLKA